MVADAGAFIEFSEGLNVTCVTEHYGELPLPLHTVPLQLLTYHMAFKREADMFKAGHFAKSVSLGECA